MMNITNKIEFENNLYVAEIDASKANSSKEERIKFVTDISSITLGRLGQIYKDEDINNLQEYTGCIGKRRLNLYNKLLKESNNRPSTPFEFIPVRMTFYSLYQLFVTYEKGRHIVDFYNKILKYSYVIEEPNNISYILTNMRCLLNAGIKEEDIPFNTAEEVEGFKVVVCNIPKVAFDHLVTHGEVRRIAESSRNKKYLNEVEFHYPEDFGRTDLLKVAKHNDEIKVQSMFGYISRSQIKPEDATKELSCRRLMLCAFHGWLQNENSWQNLFNLRINPKAQSITQQVVINIKQVIK